MIMMMMMMTKNRARNETPSHSYGASLAIRDHSVTCHPTQVNTPRLNPSQTCWYLVYLPERIEGWVDLGDWLQTEIVYPPADGHPSKY